MSSSNNTYPKSKLYRNFQQISSGEFRIIIRFYETYREKINELSFEEHFEVSVAYVQALFEIGNYEAYLRSADSTIESIIIYNIRFHKGIDIYEDLLFKKAASYHHLHNYQAAKELLMQLIRMSPENSLYQRMMKKSVLRIKPHFMRQTRATSVLLFMLTALIIAFEVLVVQNWWPDNTQYFTHLRHVTFALAVTALAIGDLWHRLKIQQLVKQILRQARSKN